MWQILKTKLALFSILLMMGLSISGYGLYQWMWQIKSQQAYQTYQIHLQKTLSEKIKEKQNANLILALTLAQIQEAQLLLDPKPSIEKQIIAQDFFHVSQRLKQDSHYKNIWIQVIDAHGVSRYRSWTSKTGDSVVNVRADVQTMIQNHRIQKTIGVGKFALSIKAMVPIITNGHFLGMVEVIGRLNSINIAVQREQNLHNAVVLIDKKWVAQLKHKHKDRMIDGYYSALDNTEGLGQIKSLDKESLKKLYQSNHYRLMNGTFVYPYPILNKQGSLLGKWILFKNANLITADIKAELQLQFLIGSGIVGMLLLLWLMSAYAHYKAQFERVYYQSIFNLASSIMFVSNRKIVVEANDAFFKFFTQYKSLAAFNADHDCICDLFKSGKGYLQTMINGISWRDYLTQFPDEEHLAKIDHPEKGERILRLKASEILSGPHAGDQIVLMEDVTEEQKLKQTLHYQIVHDELTGLYNRYFFNQNMQQLVAMSQRYKHSLSLISFDIDHFKQVNDSFGHDVGDMVIKELALTVQSQIRNTDLVCRVGGEEFSIMMPETSLAAAASIAEKLRIKVSEIKFPQVGYPITISLGVVELIDSDTDDILYKRADNALYKAKDQGRNQVVFDNEY